MSKSYTVKAGDSFQSIARRSYGNDQYASNIAKANPGASEPLTPGTVLAIPAIPGQPLNKPLQSPTATVNEVALLIDGVRYRYWSGLRLARSLDGIDTVEFAAPFEPDAPGFREVFRPFGYKDLSITVGGEPLFTGTLVGVVPVLKEDQRSLDLSGYALPGVLNDCTPPASMFADGIGEIEFDDQSLRDIATTLCKPFGILPVFKGPIGATFERVSISPSDKIFSFLSDLARQRGLVLSNDSAGSLVFQQSVNTGNPVAILKQGLSPLVSVTPSFSPQEYYSSVTGLESVYTGTDGSQYTVKNSHLSGVVRPFTFESPDVIGGDIADSVAAKLGRMFGNMASYSVSLSTWRDPAGNLWAPNTTVLVDAPGAMIYSKYEFIIRSVSFFRDSKGESADLELVLPGSFSGKIPETLPWD